MSAPERTPGVPWRRHALWACLAALYAACIFLLSEIPGARLSQFGFRHTIANLGHIPLYAGFTAFVLMAFAGVLPAVRRGPWPTLYTIAAVMTYAITDEIHQRSVPGRFASAGDLALDFVGASIALGVTHLAARRGGRARGRALAGRAGAVSPGLLPVLAVAALAFAIYLPSLQSGFTNWDDPATVIENQAIRSLGWRGLVEQARAVTVGHWAPVSTFSFAIDHALWGLDPFGYHLTNVLLHALATGLLALLMLRLGAPAPAALLGAAIFAVHPAHVEVVAWVTQRRELLAFCFMVLSLLAYARATRAEPPIRSGLLASFGLYVAALLSKSNAMIFPVVLFLYDLGFRRGDRLRHLAGKIPFLAVAAVAATIQYWNAKAIEVAVGGWLGGTPATHLATTAGLFARYARILLFPTGLSALYDPPAAQSVVEAIPLAGCGILLLGAAGIRWAWRRDRRLLVWMGFFWAGFAPVSQVVTSSTLMADRYLFVPSAGFAALCGWLLLALRRGLSGAAARALWGAAVVGAIACLALLSMARERVWRDPLALWSDTVRKPPVSWSSDYNYAKTLADQGDVRGAVPYYERALTKTNSIKVITNLGNAYAVLGEMERAEALLRRAAMLPEGLPANRAQAAFNLGLVLEARDRPEAALVVYQQAIRLDPRDVASRVALARVLRSLGRATEARIRLEQALALDPGNAEAEIGLAGLDADAGRLEGAGRRLDAVIARRGNVPEALLERARIEARAGNAASARADLERALDLAPPGRLRMRIQEALRALPERGAPAAGR